MLHPRSSEQVGFLGVLIGLDAELLHSLKEQDQFVLVVADVIRQVLILDLFPGLSRTESLLAHIEGTLKRLSRSVFTYL